MGSTPTLAAKSSMAEQVRKLACWLLGARHACEGPALTETDVWLRRVLVESEQEQHAGEDQEVLQGDRTPVKAGGQQIEGIGGQQTATEQGGALPGDPAEEPVEQPHAGGSGEQHGEAHHRYADAKPLEYGAVKPGFQSAQVTHEHQREARAAPRVLVSDGVRLEDAVGEEGFVVLNAQTGHESATREEKQQAGGQGGKSEIEISGEMDHLLVARISMCALFF